LNVCEQGGCALDGQVHLAGEQIRHRLRGTLVGHVKDVDAGRDLEQLSHQMRRRADGRSEIQLAGIRLGVGDEFAQRVCGHPGRDPEHERDA